MVLGTAVLDRLQKKIVQIPKKITLNVRDNLDFFLKLDGLMSLVDLHTQVNYNFSKFTRFGVFAKLQLRQFDFKNRPKGQEHRDLAIVQWM